MKIENGRPVGAAGASRKTGASAAPGFSVPADSPVKAGGASSVAATPSLDAILALQAEGLDPDRRRRQVRRAQDALDALSELERGLVLGRAPGGLEARLQSMQRGLERTGDPGLDAVLDEIDIRVAVELAKLEMSAAARAPA